MDIYTLTPDGTTIDSVSVGINTSDTEPLGGGATTEEQSEQVPSWSVEASCTSEYAARNALALAELGGAISVQPVPIPAVEVGLGGYYVATGATRDPRRKETERQPGDEAVSVDLARKGTRRTHWLAVETSPSQPEPGHEFGNDLSGLVGIPAASERVRLVDATTEPDERDRAPDPVDTVAAAGGDVDVYDATSESIAEPVYLYDLAYADQGDVDPVVWDTYGAAERVDATGAVAWGRVFDTAHDVHGELVLENGVVRVTFGSELEAGAWDATADSWTTISLPEYPGDVDTDWRPADVDLTHIGQARVAAQVEFEAVDGTNAGDVYALDIEVERGRSAVEVWIPESVTEAMPVDLEALLEPIASESVVDSGVEQSLVARKGVRL